MGEGYFASTSLMTNKHCFSEAIFFLYPQRRIYCHLWVSLLLRSESIYNHYQGIRVVENLYPSDDIILTIIELIEICIHILPLSWTSCLHLCGQVLRAQTIFRFMRKTIGTQSQHSPWSRLVDLDSQCLNVDSVIGTLSDGEMDTVHLFDKTSSVVAFWFEWTFQLNPYVK